MESLTKRLGDGQPVMDCKSCALCGKNCTTLACRNRLKDRLAAYEDTGLEPEEVNVVAGLASENCVKTADKIDQILAEDTELSEYRYIGTATEFRTLKETEQKRREGCELCTMPDGTLARHLILAETGDGTNAVFCPLCGRDLRGESHD